MYVSLRINLNFFLAQWRSLIGLIYHCEAAYNFFVFGMASVWASGLQGEVSITKRRELVTQTVTAKVTETVTAMVTEMVTEMVIVALRLAV